MGKVYDLIIFFAFETNLLYFFLLKVTVDGSFISIGGGGGGGSGGRDGDRAKVIGGDGKIDRRYL